jgi:HAD superfamily hydrolase (TIGR01484 family)
MSREIRAVADLPVEICRNLQVLFCDLDDTLTEGGLLPVESYDRLWRLNRCGVGVVPVTGRPAGWCDHLARMWPVAGVVGENGAFYFRYDRRRKRMIRSHTLTEEQRREGRRRLENVRRRALQEVPGAAVAADQPYRIADLAIDFCEDVEPLSRADVRRICAIAEEEGAAYRVSSIHVNCWYGDFSKITCVKRFTGEQLDRRFASLPALFIGDSPNDEPLFQEFETSIGVANLRDFMDDMRFLPGYMTRREAARGFVEAMDVITGKRGGSAVGED